MTVNVIQKVVKICDALMQHSICDDGKIHLKPSHDIQFVNPGVEQLRTKETLPSADPVC